MSIPVLMRENETDEVVNLFRENFNIPLIDVDAGDTFLTRLTGVSDPEEKEKLLVLLLSIFLKKRQTKLAEQIF